MFERGECGSTVEASFEESGAMQDGRKGEKSGDGGEHENKRVKEMTQLGHGTHVQTAIIESIGKLHLAAPRTETCFNRCMRSSLFKMIY